MRNSGIWKLFNLVVNLHKLVLWFIESFPCCLLLSFSTKLIETLSNGNGNMPAKMPLENRRACHLNCTGLISPRSTEILVISHFFCGECQRTLQDKVKGIITLFLSLVDLLFCEILVPVVVVVA